MRACAAALLPLIAGALACGTGAVTTTPPHGADGGDPDAGIADGGAGGGSGDGGSTPVIDTLLGIWKLSGTDPRGAYSGEFELRDAGGGTTTALRVVRYPGVAVEDGRELWTAWTGAGTISGVPGVSALSATVAVSLARADFVRSRGGVTRTAADRTPLAVTGEISVTGGVVRARWTADGVALDDLLADRADSAAAPIFAKAFTRTPAYPQPGATTLTSMNSLYASFQALPEVQPYSGDPAFKAAVGYLDRDQTDFAFYRARPDALRVVDKVVDAPSLGETLARANAYRKTLAAKAALFDAETPSLFLEPVTGQLADNVSAGVQRASGDGALWSATYLGSQALRYLVTHEAAALANVAKVAVGIQLLMEIVPDQTTFARTLRAATASPAPGWHTGTGPFAAIEWLEGGNNDMFKGLFYGTLLAYATLCDPLVPGQEALCARLRGNAVHMAADLTVAQGGPTNGNRLLASWLSYYLTGGSLTTLLGAWSAQTSLIENAGFQTKQLATADWSGTHLTFIEFAGLLLLADRKPIPTVNAKTTIRKGVEKMRGDFSTSRMGLWSVLFATKVSTPAAADVDDARWRLREIPAPRMQLDIDHRVAADFVMAPYPSLPWKNDWTVNDRTDSLYGYPLFAHALDVYVWRTGPWGYRGNQEGVASPSVDYLHAYWLGRYLGLFSELE